MTIFYLIYFLGISTTTILAQREGFFGQYDITGTISLLTNLGFAVWLGWYTITYTIPKIHQSHDNVIKEINSSHETSNKYFVDKIEKISGEFKSDLQKIREECDNDMRIFWDEHKEELKLRREENLKLLVAMQKLEKACADI